MEFDITKMVEEIAMQAIENQEEFIFETINPYCENVLQMKVNKEELKQILFNGIQKQQPCEDCVKREDVRNGMIKYGFLSPDMTVTEFVEDLPSVTPSRPKGKWILTHPLQADDPGAYTCSVCGYGDWGLDPKIDNFCFNCGADMRESEDEE